MNKTKETWTWNSISKRFNKIMKAGRITKVVKAAMKGKGRKGNGKRIKQKAQAGK